MHRANSVRHADTVTSNYEVGEAGSAQPAQFTPTSAYTVSGRESFSSSGGGQQRSGGKNKATATSSLDQVTRHRSQQANDSPDARRMGNGSRGTKELSMSNKRKSQNDELGDQGDINLLEQQQQQQQQAGASQAGQLRAYFSDGDFTEVLIKVDEHDDSLIASGCCHSVTGDGCAKEQRDHQANSLEQSIDSNKKIQRRRSSCSDAEGSDSKRSSLA